MEQVNGNKKGIVWIVTIMVLWVLMVPGALAHHPKGSTRQFDIEPLSNIDNPRAEFKIDLWTDRDDATYRIGDRVTFFFKADRDCRVTLLNVGTDGKVLILFPNEYHKDNRVKAGTVYIIPPREAKFAIKASAPAGVDTVKAIATLDKVALIKEDDITPVKGFIKGFRGINKNVRTLTIELEEVLKPMNPRTWAETQKIVKIIPDVSE